MWNTHLIQKLFSLVIVTAVTVYLNLVIDSFASIGSVLCDNLNF